MATQVRVIKNGQQIAAINFEDVTVAMRTAMGLAKLANCRRPEQLIERGYCANDEGSRIEILEVVNA